MPTERPKIPVLAGFHEISANYDALLCDVWGVLHNGRESFPDACRTLQTFRKGGAVILITNAPRPNEPIRQQLAALGVPADAFDAIVTSGDVTISLVAERMDQAVHHIGPERDLGLFDAAAERAGRETRLVGLDDADYVLCTGLFDDDHETADDYAGTLDRIAERRLPFICANPDLVVHRGEKLIYCAGALAEALKARSGEAIYCGKPHAPIYDATLAAAEKALGRPLDRRRVLAIGDGMRTDIAGAGGQGIDALFVSGGIHAGEVHTRDDEAAALSALFAREGHWPVATIRALTP